MQVKKVVSLFLLIILLASVFCACSEQPSKVGLHSEDFNGKRIGVLTGSIFDSVANKNLEAPSISYYNSNSDLALALETGKIDAYVNDEPVWRNLSNEYPDQKLITFFSSENYAFAFRKNDEKSALLCQQMSEFLRECKGNGVLKEIDAIWFGMDEDAKVINMDGLTAENGTLSFATTTDIGVPFSYIKDNQFAGYDVDIAVRFCRAYGYGIEIVNSSFEGMLASVSGGKSDFCGACITVTPERSENMLFSEADYVGGSVLVAKDGEDAAAGNKKTDMFSAIIESFIKTFIRENRYQLFLSGIGTTLLVIGLSLIFGTLFGFVLYLIYYRSGKLFRTLIYILTRITDNTPVVVILMILYYIVFGSVHISGVVVSVIGFTVILTGAVVGNMQVGVGAVDVGQREAALALGYTENRAFMRVILPQAAVHFLPGYKGAIVQLIKGTAIVGYIAVQDLTKVSDIIRSRTYEAFFPLIVTAIVYFLLAVVMSALVNRIGKGIDPESRKRIRLLEGVETK